MKIIPHFVTYFTNNYPHSVTLAVRVWQGPYSVEKAKTIAGKEITLLNLPFYLVHRIERELDRVTDTKRDVESTEYGMRNGDPLWSPGNAIREAKNEKREL